MQEKLSDFVQILKCLKMVSAIRFSINPARTSLRAGSLWIKCDRKQEEKNANL